MENFLPGYVSGIAFNEPTLESYNVKPYVIYHTNILLAQTFNSCNITCAGIRVMLAPGTNARLHPLRRSDHDLERRIPRGHHEIQ